MTQYPTEKNSVTNSHELEKYISKCLLQRKEILNQFNTRTLQDVTIWEKPIEWFWETLEPLIPSITLIPSVASKKSQGQARKEESFGPVSGPVFKENEKHETH